MAAKEQQLITSTTQHNKQLASLEKQVLFEFPPPDDIHFCSFCFPNKQAACFSCSPGLHLPLSAPSHSFQNVKARDIFPYTLHPIPCTRAQSHGADDLSFSARLPSRLKVLALLPFTLSESEGSLFLISSSVLFKGLFSDPF